MIRVSKDETSVKILYFRSVSGNGSTPFLIKGTSGQLSGVGLETVTELSWRLEDEEAMPEIGTKRPLTCAIDISTKKRITSFNG